MLTEEQKLTHKEFRIYLRTIEYKKGNMLKTIINATENNLPALIRKHFRHDFDCIYDDKYSIVEMMNLSLQLKSNEEILAEPYGYISSLALDFYIRFYAQKNGINLDDYKNTEESEQNGNESEEDAEKRQIEGRLTEAKILRRSRNRAARQKCLEDSGYTCYVCGFNFEKAYGEIGKGFLEVHHTKPLSTYDNEHEIPQSELCALCSNCHSMVHRKKEVLDVDILRKIFEGNK